MIVRYYWPDYEPRESAQRDPVDAFWVEATLEEAAAAVFPYLSGEQKESSEREVKDFGHIAKEVGDPPRPYCFLVAKDLRSIEPYPVHYPFHHGWNAYSPFRYIGDYVISKLEQLASLQYTPSDD